MTEGQTSLNIKDYPFAFSITALFFPNLLTETNSTAIFGVLLVGGMVGSLLTIINPGRLLMRYNYSKKEPFEIYYSVISNQLIPKRNLIAKIIKKNFKAATSSPPITFEIDKTIGMIYFIIILSATLIRAFTPEFSTAVNNNIFLIIGVRAGAAVGLIGVISVLINHHFGFNFKFHKFRIKPVSQHMYFPDVTTSHFDRIVFVTIANLAIDFGNLISESNKWHSDSALRHQVIHDRMITVFYTFDKEVTKTLGDGWSGSFLDFKEHLQKNQIDHIYKNNGISWNDNTIQELYNKFIYIKQEISIGYSVKFSEALGWFVNSHRIEPNSLYDLEPKLRSFIDSRDWNSAYLSKYRIMDMIETILRQKNIPEQIN